MEVKQLQKIESFRRDLALAESFEEIKVISDAAAAYADFARRINISKEKQDEIGMFRVDIEEKLGEWLEENFPHGGEREQGSSGGTLMPVTKQKSHRARRIKNLKNEKPEIFNEIIEEIKQDENEVVTPNAILAHYNRKVADEKKEAVKEKEKEYQDQIKEISEFDVDIFTTDKKFNIIYADPAWSYWEGGYKNQSLHYKTMSIDEIKSLPVSNISDDDCILFIWVTFPILKEALEVIESWGFKYSTCGFVWVKKNKNSDSWFFGNGSWTRANSELCLIGTKGSITRLDASISQVLDDRIGEHSEKPERVRQLITKLVGELPRIELFSRNTNNDGWFNWGNKI